MLSLARRLVLLLAFAAAGWPLSAHAAGVGVIDGRLVEKTAGASLQSGATAYLYKTANGQDPTQQDQTNVDSAGHFRFTLLDTDPSISYEVGVQYGGAPYFGDQVTFAQGETSRQISLDVYETTPDDGVLSLGSTSLLVDPDDKTHELAVLELNNFTNASDRTFIPSTTPRNGGPPSLLRFSLPPNATDLTPGDGLTADDIIQINTGFGAMAPLIPGSHDIGFSYRWGYQSSGTSFTLNLVYATKTFRILMPVGSGQVDSPQLQRQPDQNIGGKPFALLMGTNLAAGSAITFRFSNLPGISPLATLSQPQTLPVLAGCLAAVVLGLLGWYIYDRRKNAAAGAEPASVGDRHDLEVQRRELLIAMARLDDRHDAGLIADADYRAQRDVHKAELRDLMQHMEALGPV